MIKSKERVYPQILNAEKIQPKIPLSFVVIKFSGDYENNFILSECVNNPINQVIKVENHRNIYFNNLSHAIDFGVRQATNEIIIVVHEDVLFPDNWQFRFEQSLTALEKHDKEWGLLGSVGWVFNPNQKLIGHVSDPNGYVNSFVGKLKPYAEIDKLDEQILVLHKSRLPKFDVNLPSIHFLGQDLPHSINGLKSYVIDAPTVHKYADENGNIILERKGSPKIQDRKTIAYLADFEFCLDYFKHKRPEVVTPKAIRSNFNLPEQFNDELRMKQLLSPVFIVSNSAISSQLLSQLFLKSSFYGLGKFNGDFSINISDELLKAFYHAVLIKFKGHQSWQLKNMKLRILYYAAQSIKDFNSLARWFIHVPESEYLLFELKQKFSMAKFVFLRQKKEFASTEKIYISSDLNNQIGRAVIPAIYDYFNLNRKLILQHSKTEINVLSELFRGLQIQDFKNNCEHQDCWVNIETSDLIRSPNKVVRELSKFLDVQLNLENARALFKSLNQNSLVKSSQLKKLALARTLIKKYFKNF